MASTTDIPERPRPQVTRYRVGVCRCTVCGHHPDVAPDQYGVTAHRLGPRVMAATVYQVRPRHRHEAVQEVIPPDYAGLMVTDRGRSDDAHAFDGVAQHKCLAHILRSISEVVATKSGRARDVGEPLKGLLQEALALWHAHHGGRVTDFKVEAESEPVKPPLIPWGTYTLGPETAGELLRHLNPRLAILKHYRDNLALPATTEIIVLRRRGDKE